MKPETKLTVSVVSYLNSLPFIYGLEHYAFSQKIELQKDIPSICAEKLLSGKADIGLVPVAILPLMKSYHIVSDYGIAADGNVDSVLLLSNVPLEKIETVQLDYQSRTSVNLVKILAKQLWNINPVWENAAEGFEAGIGKQNTAAVVIGDRALLLKDKFNYVYDLAGEWKKMTGLSFVFACWVSANELDKGFKRQFNEALKLGLDNIPQVLAQLKGSVAVFAPQYLQKNIKFELTEPEKQGLELFLRYLQK